MRSSRPSIAELREVCQPGSVMDRRSAEHWAGRLYMRRLSLHVTRWLLDAPVSPNGLTVLMIVVGLLAAVAAAWPGVLTALLALAGVQAYLLLDCVDGEVARWRKVTSAAGVYLDRLGHFTVEAALLVALGVRAAGGPGQLDLWAWLGATAAVLALLNKVGTDLVTVARAASGLPLDVEPDPEPRQVGLRSVRSLVGRLPVQRMLGAVELSLLLVATAVVDTATGTLVATRVLVVAAAVIAAAAAVGHPVMVLASRRLR